MINHHLKEKIANNYWLSKMGKVAVSKGSSVNNLVSVNKEVTQPELNYFKKISQSDTGLEIAILTTLYTLLLKRYFPNHQWCIQATCDVPDRLLFHKLFFLLEPEPNFTVKNYLEAMNREIQESIHFGADIIETIDSLNLLPSERFTPFYFSYSEYQLNAEEIDAPFCLYVVQSSKGLSLKLQYNPDFNESQAAIYFLESFKDSLDKLCDLIDTPYYQIPLASSEIDTIKSFNHSIDPVLKQTDLVSIFESQVLKRQDAIALEYGDRSYTYASLNYEVNRLANHILSVYGNLQDQMIGVIMQKSDSAVIAILAILKLGAAYVPIDPSYPVERIKYIIENSQLLFSVVDNDWVAANLDLNTLVYDISLLQDNLHENINISIAPEQLAYVIYTSGSTGLPKGVLIRHTGVVNMCLDQIRVFELNAADCVVWFASIAFDASVSEIFMAFFSGAKLVVPTNQTIKILPDFKLFLLEKNASVITLPPSYLNLLSVSDLRNIRVLITAGEPAIPKKALEIAENIRYFNAYGPTECSVCVSIYEVKPSLQLLDIPIGRPIANTQVFILDDHFQFAPLGAIGEIYVSGVGLAIGYQNNEALTQERFFPNPFIAGTMLYKTGDKGRWLETGDIQYCGRIDDQVKIRGHRVEPLEVESVLRKLLPFIDDLLVLTTKNDIEVKLVAYLAKQNIKEYNLDINKIKADLAQILPAYMIPAHVILFDSFPVNINGKVDKRLLINSLENEIEMPADLTIGSTTHDLLQIWQKILQLRQISTQDDFFELGGNSLNIAFLTHEISKHFDIEILFGELLSQSKFVQQVTLINARIGNKPPELTSYTIEGDLIPVSSAQRALWTACQTEQGSLAHQMCLLLEFNVDLNIPSLETAFRLCIDRHEILRTAIISVGNQLYQKVIDADAFEFGLEVISFEAEFDTDQHISTVKEIIKKDNQLLKIEAGEVLRAKVYKFNDKRSLLKIDFHHIAGDEWSAGILKAELFTLYFQLIDRKIIAPPTQRLNYRNYTIWEQEFLNGSAHTDHLAYWREMYGNKLKPLNLFSKPDKGINEFEGNEWSFEIDRQQTLTLKSLSKKLGCSQSVLFIALYYLLMVKYTGSNDFIIGMPVALRDNYNLNDQLGPYIAMLPLRLESQQSYTFRQLVETVKGVIENAISNKYADPEKIFSLIDLKARPLNIVINVLNNIGIQVPTFDDTMTQIEIKSNYSKFPLCLYVGDDGNYFDLRFEYQLRYFNPDQIRKMSDRFLKLINVVSKTDQLKLRNIEFAESITLPQFINTYE